MKCRSEWYTQYLNKLIELLQYIKNEQYVTFGMMTDKLKVARETNRNIFVIGNGGSAANASHFVEDLSKGSSDAIQRRPSPFQQRFKALTFNDFSYLMALANDYSYEDIFVRQLMNLANEKDILIGISVSGTSKNVVKAFEWANNMGLYTIALCGEQAKNKPDNNIDTLAALSLVVPDTHFGRVEDVTMVILHMLSYVFMETEV
jgi:D-sedoheptulose 7-phosphate isomerase